MVEKWPKDHWKKKKEILFPGSYDNVKINESTKAFRLIDDQCSWVTINLTALTILPLDISRGSHPCKHTALPLAPAPARRSRQCKRAGKRRAAMQKIQLGTGKSSINSVANTFPNHQLHYLNASSNIWFWNATKATMNTMIDIARNAKHICISLQNWF